MNCQRSAMHAEDVNSEHWRFVVLYCDEHWRELNKGVPLGPMGIDRERVVIESLEAVVPQAGGLLPGST
jgi:hypothetical protein